MDQMFFGVLKEPRGILKPIEWLLAIFAFATMTGSQLNIAFDVTCKDGNVTQAPVNLQLSSSYPYRLEDAKIETQLCNQSVSQALLQGAGGSSQFYVFVGVMVFLYCMAALVLYIMFDQTYRKHNACTIGDFIISGVIVALWLIGSSAWAQGVTDLKYYTNLEESGYFTHIKSVCSNGNTCVQTRNANFASLNVSIIFGFLNMVVWAGNMWFLFKETPWHKVNQSKPPEFSGATSGPTDQQRI
ncbi:synaptophysin-like [Mya arenaria]|uniref:synaptophysin-like n=1 Tax=Mya arenaria TaxID=6604 RepID=UPI0022E6F2ED|nr:synaptophysin-like [Mya arenaria]